MVIGWEDAHMVPIQLPFQKKERKKKGNCYPYKTTVIGKPLLNQINCKMIPRWGVREQHWGVTEQHWRVLLTWLLGRHGHVCLQMDISASTLYYGISGHWSYEWQMWMTSPYHTGYCILKAPLKSLEMPCSPHKHYMHINTSKYGMT